MSTTRSHRLASFFLVSGSLVLSLVGAPREASATFHLWYIKEIFSNSSGSVQFVELFTDFATQQFLSGHTLTSNANTFTFPGNSPAPTNGHHLLLATSGFDAIPGGATPNFIIPSNFFNPAGDTLNFAGGFDIDTFVSAPTDGINSLNYTSATSAATVAVNSPRNYAGAGGSVDLSTPSPTGDYNQNGVVDAADYVAWRDTFSQAVSPAGSGADGNSSGTIDGGDFDFWRARFGNTVGSAAAFASGAVPEPQLTTLLLIAVLVAPFSRFNRQTNR